MIVDHLGGAEGSNELVVGWSSGDDHLEPIPGPELDGEVAHPACSRGHQHPLAFGYLEDPEALKCGQSGQGTAVASMTGTPPGRWATMEAGTTSCSA